jgi:hypothetical protein
MVWTTVLNATSGQSSALSVDYRWGRPVLINVNTATSGSSGDWTLQFTMYDLTSSAVATSSGFLGAPVWLNATAAGPFGFAALSSAVTSSAAYGSLHFESSTIDINAGLPFVPIAPVAGVRLNSTALSTSLTLTLLQAH